jgi:F-type H+-transporting ATPase subunit gamma
MASTQQLKRRIGSVKNTKQITKAMEMVAASKMRRAQDHAMQSREFRRLARRILARLSEVTNVAKHPLYAQRSISTRMHVFITSDRGLAGAFYSNLFRSFMRELQADREKGVASKVIVIGRKGAHFISKLDGVETVAVYDGFPEHPTAADIQPILRSIIDMFKAEQADAVDVTYTDFRSSISQVVVTERLLPAVFKETEQAKPTEEFDRAMVEPSPEEVLEQISERLVEVQLSQAFRESQASEHSSRMMAMKSATDNAGDLIDDLTLAYNTARQASITQELAEITGGAEAIN